MHFDDETKHVMNHGKKEFEHLFALIRKQHNLFRFLWFKKVADEI